MKYKMTTYQHYSCNSEVCSHPSCWNYHRKLLKNPNTPEESFIKKHSLETIDVPHQSIINLGTDTKTVSSFNGLENKHFMNNQKNNAIIQYLLSRHNNNGSGLTKPRGKLTKSADNVDNRVAKLNVHEVFDEDELKSDWRSSFKTKDVYVWIPGAKDEKGMKPRKSRKTPIMQLAPVHESSRLQSGLSFGDSRRNQSSNSIYTDILNKNQQIEKKTTTKSGTFKKTKSPRITNQKIKKNEKYNELSQSLNNQKMQIHIGSQDKPNVTKADFYCSEPTFRLDPRPSNDNSFYFFPTRAPLPSSAQFSESTQNSISSLYGLPRPAALKLRKIGVIDEASIDSFSEMKLGPHKTPNSLNTSSRSSTSSKSIRSLPDSLTNNSLQINALSSRSTLDDDDLLPGNSVLKMLQQSYELVRQRSDQLDHQNQILNQDDQDIRSKSSMTHDSMKSAGSMNNEFNNLTKSHNMAPQLEHRQKQMMLMTTNERAVPRIIGGLEIQGNTVRSNPNTNDRSSLQSAPGILTMTTTDNTDLFTGTSNHDNSPDPPPPSPDLTNRLGRAVSAAPNLYTVHDNDEEENDDDDDDGDNDCNEKK